MTTTIVLPDSDNLKRCGKCHEWKPFEAYTRDSSKPDGLRTVCRVCTAAYREANREQIRARNREYMRGYYVEHKDEIHEYQRHWHAANKDKVYQRVRNWVSEHKDVATEYQRRYREEHRDHLNEYGRAYKKHNAAQVRANNNKRRANKLGSGGSYTAEDLVAIRAAQTDKQGHLNCWRCGKPIKGKPHLDHWIPLDKQGPNSAGNLHYMHARCNLNKSKKHPTEIGRLL